MSCTNLSTNQKKKQMMFNPLERCDSAVIVINCLIWSFHVTHLSTKHSKHVVATRTFRSQCVVTY